MDLMDVFSKITLVCFVSSIMSLYQSKLWKHITEHIYQKPVFTVSILGKEYQGVMKVKQKFWQSFRWFMVHGVSIWDMTYFNDQFKKDIAYIQRDFGKSSTDMFFQLWFVDVFATHQTSEIKESQELQQEVVTKRDYIASDLWQRYDMKHTVREHMPEATIVLDLRNDKTDFKDWLSSSWKRYVNKWAKAWLTFEVAQESDREAYRELRYKMSYDKRFSVQPKDIFLHLMNYLTETKQWVLLLAKKDGDIVSGMVCLTSKKSVYYLYGATDRAYWSIWAQYWLTLEVMHYFSDLWYKTLDLLGVAPTGSHDHYLTGVTRYKQAFWWRTVEYVWNYDLVLNRWLYRAWKAWRGL